jgi:hypothetical protein
MKRAIYCALISAAVGFVIAAFVAMPEPFSVASWMPQTVAYILCPPGIFGWSNDDRPGPGKHLVILWPS